jgi:DNA-binding CsgD family transcriptional regulator
MASDRRSPAQDQTMPDSTSPERSQPEPEGAPAASLADPASPTAMAWPTGLFVLITFFVGGDMAADLSAGIGFTHLGIEAVALVIGLAGTWATGLQLKRSLARSHSLARHLEGTLTDLDQAREEANELRRGLGVALEHQFDKWSLTLAQREVALLVLKGLSYKEIAELRSTAEHTVRNQALSIYRKAGLTNRAEMAAFFLEDLLVPTPASRPGSFRSRLSTDERVSGTDGRAG